MDLYPETLSQADRLLASKFGDAENGQWTFTAEELAGFLTARNRVEAAPTPGGIDFSTWSYNTLPERTGNVGWQPDLQDLIYTAINHVEGDYEDADENCAEQVIERLVLAIKGLVAREDGHRQALERIAQIKGSNGARFIALTALGR